MCVCVCVCVCVYNIRYEILKKYVQELIFLLHSRLALYVYEYLLHVGAQKAAQTFLSEVSLMNE